MRYVNWVSLVSLNKLKLSQSADYTNLSSQWFLKGGSSNAKREKEKGGFGLGSGQLRKLAH